ncbi:hypothetical protein NB704_003373 [Pantoea ananatis]|nr:hypothetical protein [Pantoea ananatis]
MCPSEQIFCPRKITLPAQRCLNGARREPPSAVLILFYSDEKKPVFADRFLKYGRRERITRPCGTRPSGRCVRNVVSLRSAQPSSEVLILFYSGEKKPVFTDRFLKMVGERGLRAPAGRALRAVAFATLSRFARRNPPSEVLILFYLGEKKPVFADRFLKMVGERGLGLLRKPPSGRCVRNVVSLRSAQPSFGGSHPLLFRRKKNLSLQTGF